MWGWGKSGTCFAGFMWVSWKAWREPCGVQLYEGEGL